MYAPVARGRWVVAARCKPRYWTLLSHCWPTVCYDLRYLPKAGTTMFVHAESRTYNWLLLSAFPKDACPGKVAVLSVSYRLSGILFSRTTC